MTRPFTRAAPVWGSSCSTSSTKLKTLAARKSFADITDEFSFLSLPSATGQRADDTLGANVRRTFGHGCRGEGSVGIAVSTSALDAIRSAARCPVPGARDDGCETWFGIGPHGGGLPYIDILLSSEDESGQVHFVVLNKAPPSVMREIVAALALSDVCALDSGDQVNLDGYTDEDPYFAKKPIDE
ncbi:hypothetical protein [Variovorax paradoxus]|uniref:hypothetical protein n=1 Tax=Variovorax paradoxus TaxID=34073 RepID=UPI003D65E3F7